MVIDLDSANYGFPVTYLDATPSVWGDAGAYDWPTSNAVATNSFMGALRLLTGISAFDLPSEAVEVSAADGTLDQATAAQIHTALVGELSVHSGVKAVKVTGDRAFVPLALDLGIAPRLDVLGAEATATYAAPALEIVAFDPEPKSGRFVANQVDSPPFKVEPFARLWILIGRDRADAEVVRGRSMGG